MDIEYIIEYVGVIDTALPITVDTTLLEGGSTDSFTATVEILREYSTRPLYSPVPYDFLRVASATPIVNLKVNSIPALCSDCSFEFDSSKTIVVNSATLTDEVLGVTMTIPAARRLLQSTVTLDDITVTLG